MQENRTANSIKNYSVTVISQIISILLSFIGRTFFVKLLSIEYLGVNGLFTNILSILSLAELGIGTAITYMMYNPIATDNIEKVAAYNQLFRKIYNFIGLFILTLGACITPFIYSFIKDDPNIPENLHIVFVLFVINSAISYFYTYKRSLLIAYQKEYINNKNIIEFAIIKDVVLIAILFASKDYYLYLTAQIIITFASNVAISKKTNKLFPHIVTAKPQTISNAEIKTIKKNTIAMICHKIGSVIVSSTGNIFISYFVGLAMVGIYSNYLLISTCISQIIGKGVNSVTASLGNLVAESDLHKIYNVYEKIYFLNFTLSFLTALYFYVMADSFVTIWLGKEFLIDKDCLFIIALNFLFFYQIRIPSQMIINTFGLFWQIKWKSLVEAGINLLGVYIFTAYLNMGIKGILLSALISNILTNLWWEPYVAFKHGMKQPLLIFYKRFIKDTLTFLTLALVLKNIIPFIYNLSDNVIIQMFLLFVTASISSVAILYLIYGNTYVCKESIKTFKTLFLRRNVISHNKS